MKGCLLTVPLVLIAAVAQQQQQAAVRGDGAVIVAEAEGVPTPASPPSPAFSAAPSFGPPAPPTAGPATPGAAARCAPDDQPSDAVTRFQRTWICLTLTGSSPAPPAPPAPPTLPATPTLPAPPSPPAPSSEKFAPARDLLAPSSLRAAFDPVCDRFALIQAAGSYKANAARTGATLVAASSLGAASAPKIYLTADGAFVFPTYTAIVAVVDGIVRAVAFDEGCEGCGERSGSCGANTLEPAEGRRGCFVPRAACRYTPQPSNPDASTCDLKIFVVWAGEDVRGAAFTSTSTRPSRFSAYPFSAAQLWNSVTNFASSVAQGALPSTATEEGA
jgi:hypothetical protein